MKSFFKNGIFLKSAFLFLCTIAFALFTPTSFDVTENPDTNNKIDRQYNSLSTFMQKHNSIFEIEPTPTADPSDDDNHMKFIMNKNRVRPENLAFEWLSKKQEPEGYWDTKKHGGNGTLQENLLATSFSLISFLTAGHTNKFGKHKENVAIALTWLAQHQKDDGSWADDNFLNAVCSNALAEAIGMACSLEKPEALKEKVTLATTYLLGQQNKQGFFGQTKSSIQCDMFVTSWCIIALKNALVAGFFENELREALAKCAKFLDETPGTSDNGPDSKGLAWSTPNVLQGDDTLYQAAAMVIRIYAGRKRTEPWIQAATKGQIKNDNISYKDMNPYHVHLSSLATFQVSAASWRKWSNTKKKTISDSQRQDGDFAGSWDPNNVAQPAPIDRVAYTALLAVSIIDYSRW